MSTNKFTPGPWESRRIRRDDYGRQIVGNIQDDDTSDEGGEPGRTMTTVANVLGNPTSQEVTQANANLISAAPDLLAACEPVLAEAKEREDYMHDTFNPDYDVAITLSIAELRAIRAAVDKAKGL